jgi:hypothetical protein
MALTSCPRRPRHEPLFDIHPLTGTSIEVFWADTTLETFGRGAPGWFWWPRRRGFAPDGPARGPFPTSYLAYRHALHSANEHIFSVWGCNQVATAIQEKMTESD